MTLKTSQQVREEFDSTGDSISDWAVTHGYSPSLVYRVLRSKELPKRGKSHDIAVELGMKSGKVSAIRSNRQTKPLVSEDTECKS